MIAHIQGKLIEKTPTEVIIDCSGVGYLVNISLHTYAQLPESDFVKLHTLLIIREDAHTLYGFADKLERNIFSHLISVSGIGANTARTMLSSLSPAQIRQAIITDNVNQIQSVKGIGIKTAQRVILDLKDKMLKVADYNDATSALILNNVQKEEAIAALEVLGIPRKISEKNVDKYIKEYPEASAENIIKHVLKNL